MFNVVCLVLGGITSALISFKNGYFANTSLIWIFFALWLLFFVVWVGFSLLCLLIASKFLTKTPPEKPNKVAYFFVKIVISFLCFWANIKVVVKNGELIEKGKQYLLVSNHRSNFDPIIQFKFFNRCKPVMISKPENMKIPLAGPFINKAGFLPIDRNNDREALKTIIKAIKFIKEGYSVGLCPEGKRNKEGRNLLPIKVGAFKIATKSKVPIVIMTFEGTEKIAKKSLLKRTTVYIDVLKVIEPSEYENMTTQDIGDLATSLMQNNIDKYSQNIINNTKGIDNEKK